MEVGVCDFTPKWHAASGSLLGTGHSVRYQDNKLIANRARETVWSIYDPKRHTWSPWSILQMPEEDKFWNAGAGSTQRVDLASGDILLPIYFKGRQTKTYSTTIVRCRFDGRQLAYVEHGSEMTVDVASSSDGMHFDKPRKWTFDDGTERKLVLNKGAQLGNFAVVDVNDRETWVTTSEGMAPRGSEKYGANGRVYAARVRGEKANHACNRH